MKYAEFSDDFLSYFRLDDNGETLVLTDKRGQTRAVKLLSYEERPQGEWIRKKDVIHSIAKQYSEHNELVPIWLNMGDMTGGAE